MHTWLHVMYIYCMLCFLFFVFFVSNQHQCAIKTQVLVFCIGNTDGHTDYGYFKYGFHDANELKHFVLQVCYCLCSQSFPATMTMNSMVMLLSRLLEKPANESCQDEDLWFAPACTSLCLSQQLSIESHGISSYEAHASSNDWLPWHSPTCACIHDWLLNNRMSMKYMISEELLECHTTHGHICATAQPMGRRVGECAHATCMVCQMCCLTMPQTVQSRSFSPYLFLSYSPAFTLVYPKLNDTVCNAIS